MCGDQKMVKSEIPTSREVVREKSRKEAKPNLTQGLTSVTSKLCCVLYIGTNVVI